MEKQPHNLKTHRKRKFLMVLPFISLPFITLLFWVLGGGTMGERSTRTEAKKGLNLELPDPYLREGKLSDKLSYYEKVATDSARIKMLIQKDPYYSLQAPAPKEERSSTGPAEIKLEYPTSGIGQFPGTPQSGPPYSDPNEAKVYEKLEQLDRALKEASTMPAPTSSLLPVSSLPDAQGIREADFLLIEQMMEDMHGTEAEDPELQKIDAMLEKILDIQHPDRVQEKLRRLSEQRKGEVYMVLAGSPKEQVSLIDQNPAPGEDGNRYLPISGQSNGFYSLGDLPTESGSPNTIQAVVHETQTLVNGSTVKLRLVNDVYINGVRVPKDNFLFGITSLNGERLSIKINSVRYENSLFPVSLSVYDLDGLDGIYIPGAITRDVAKQSTDRAVQSVGLTTLDPSFEVQAAGAGIEAAQNLLSKKIKLIKVTVKAGYQVLLFDEKQRHEIN